jgi:hypothetical protein
MDAPLGLVIGATVRTGLAILDVVYPLASLICEGPKLMRYGPRYWRVERKMRHRAWLRRQ